MYSEANLDYALNAATCSYCQQEVKVMEVHRRIVVPAVFQWYCSDFGENDVEALRLKRYASNVSEYYLEISSLNMMFLFQVDCTFPSS